MEKTYLDKLVKGKANFEKPRTYKHYLLLKQFLENSLQLTLLFKTIVSMQRNC